MPRVVCTLMLLLASSAGATEIGSKPFGLGAMLGSPSGLSGKFYLNQRTHAIDFAFAGVTWGPYRGDAYLHATYLLSPSVLYTHPAFDMPWHIGAGGFLLTGLAGSGGGGVGARGVIGLDFDLNDYPLQFFADLSLEMLIVPSVQSGLGATLGARWYF